MDYNYDDWKIKAKEFWEETDKKNIDCDECNIMQKCVCLAFRDLTVRTMTKSDKTKTISLDNLAKEFCETEYMEKITKWINGDETWTEENFNDLHKTLCEMVREFLVPDYYEECTYGKAQKIVNMTFKYLCAYYCANSEESKDENCFKFCHMPLDSFTLEWFKRSEIPNVAKGKIGAWSNMDKKDDEKSYGYEFYYKEIKKYFETQKVTPLQAEFVIWPHIQKELAAEAFIFTFKQINEVDERRKIRGDSLNKKITRVKEIVKKM